MTFWVNSFRNVTASYGTAGFTEDHLLAFKQYNIKRILIAYDRDEAGNTAADKLAHLLNKNGIDAFRILLPKGMDVNEFAQQVTPAQKSLGLAIRKAQWLGKGKSPEITTAQESLLSNLKAESIASEPEASTTAAESIQPEQNQKPSPNHPSLAAVLAVPLPEPSTSTPIPETPALVEASITDHEISLTLGDRTYRIRGLRKNMSHEQLKVNLLVNRGEYVHIDTLDLYQSRPRHTFIKQSASELGVHNGVRNNV